MDEERPFIEELLDVALYAPVGLALTVAEDLPALIERGRRRISGQVSAARLVGRFAMRRARRRIDDLLEPSETEATVTVLRPPRRSSSQSPTPSAVAPIEAPTPGGAPLLAIPGYDALAASQVIARLDALSVEELAAVEAHELATRRRRTILNRIAQLRS